MMLGRGPLGKFVMIIFILFNLVMLCLAGLAYKIQTTPPEELRAYWLAIFVELGKEARDDRTLDKKDMADIEERVNYIMELILFYIMELILFLQAKGLQGVLIMWAIGAAIIGVLVHLTRPQPI